MAGVGLTPEAFRRVQQSVKRIEATPQNRSAPLYEAGVVAGAQVGFVRVTSTTATSGRYPAKVLTYDVDAKTWTDGDDCWAVTHDASALSATKYISRLMGILASDSLAVFMAEKPFATKARWILFTLPSALATTDASKASCTVNDFWGGADPGSTVTVYNMPASTNYIFSGASGNKGMAVYDDDADRYWACQLECP